MGTSCKHRKENTRQLVLYRRIIIDVKIDFVSKTYLNTNPLLYISLIDAMMIGGIVTQNGVGPLTEEMKEEAYNRIKVLKEIINSKEDNKKEEKIKILDELEQKIKEFTYNNPFDKYINS